MSKHTPGPWVVHTDEEGNFGVTTDYGYLVTFAFPNGDGAEAANARLIAASPDLLEVLEDVIAYHSGTGDYCFSKLPASQKDLARQEMWDEIVFNIDLALTKAKGE